jgi:hypothetical protein
MQPIAHVLLPCGYPDQVYNSAQRRRTLGFASRPKFLNRATLWPIQKNIGYESDVRLASGKPKGAKINNFVPNPSH